LLADVVYAYIFVVQLLLHTFDLNMEGRRSSYMLLTVLFFAKYQAFLFFSLVSNISIVILIM